MAHVLARHTDVLTARNSVRIAQYHLKLAQIAPYGDFDLLYGLNKESTVAPFTYYHTFQIGMPLPIGDQNKGNIISAQGALIRAVEETHRVQNALTDTLAANYTNYKNNLNALEYYRRWILPDQVRYYRGIFERRQEFPPENLINLSPAELVTAQQALATNVQTYLGILGSLWSAVVSVADLIQTPDLFQLAQPRELPELPDLEKLPRWLCPHHRLAVAPASSCVGGTGVPPVLQPGGTGVPPVLQPGGTGVPPVLPPPRRIEELPALPPSAAPSGEAAAR